MKRRGDSEAEAEGDRSRRRCCSSAALSLLSLPPHSHFPPPFLPPLLSTMAVFDQSAGTRPGIEVWRIENLMRQSPAHSLTASHWPASHCATGARDATPNSNIIASEQTHNNSDIHCIPYQSHREQMSRLESVQMTSGSASESASHSESALSHCLSVARCVLACLSGSRR